jgi:AcrR family transcriptional regulator
MLCVCIDHSNTLFNNRYSVRERLSQPTRVARPSGTERRKPSCSEGPVHAEFPSRISAAAVTAAMSVQAEIDVPIERAETAPRRADRRVGKTKRALKEALTGLILEKGYEAVTVQDIIDRADVGRSTFYAHFIDKDELMMAIFADQEIPAPHASSLQPGDPPFSWTLQLFRHFGTRKRVFRVVAGSQSGALARRETERWLDELARAELRRLGTHKRHNPRQLAIVVRFLVGTFMGFMNWWTEDENADLDAEFIDAQFRALVLPGVASVLGLDLEAVAHPKAG